jgi:hypothetical protein
VFHAEDLPFGTGDTLLYVRLYTVQGGVKLPGEDLVAVKVPRRAEAKYQLPPPRRPAIGSPTGPFFSAARIVAWAEVLRFVNYVARLSEQLPLLLLRLQRGYGEMVTPAQIAHS